MYQDVFQYWVRDSFLKMLAKVGDDVELMGMASRVCARDKVVIVFNVITCWTERGNFGITSVKYFSSRKNTVDPF